MLKAKRLSRVTLLFGVSLCIQNLFCTDDAPAPTAPVTPPDWRQSALNPEKPDGYYYTLLDVTEDDIAARATATPPTNRATVLEEKRLARLATVDVPAALKPDEREYIQDELEAAKSELLDQHNAELYRHLGHDTYSFIQQGPLFAALHGKRLTIVYRMIAQFLFSLLEDKTYDQAFNEANNPNLAQIGSSDNATEKPIGDALGSVLFESIKAEDKEALKKWIHDNPAADPDNLTVPDLHNILKQYINLLQCSLAKSACKKKSVATKTEAVEGEAAVETAGKDAAKAKTEAAGGAAGDKDISAGEADKKISAAIDKANEKIQTALHSLRQAKSYLKRLDAAQRQAAKEEVKKAIADNPQLKEVANRIRANPKYASFSNTVETVIKEVSSF